MRLFSHAKKMNKNAIFEKSTRNPIIRFTPHNQNEIGNETRMNFQLYISKF